MDRVILVLARYHRDLLHGHVRPLEHAHQLDQRLIPRGGEMHVKAHGVSPEAVDQVILDEPEDVQTDDHHAGGDERSGVEALGGKKPHCRYRPEARSGRQAAHRDAVADDGSCSQEADPGDHLSRYPIGVEARPLDAVRRGQGEGCRADRHQDVCAEAGGVLPDLALEPDDPGEDGGKQYTYDDVPDSHAHILGSTGASGKAQARENAQGDRLGTELRFGVRGMGWNNGLARAPRAVLSRVAASSVDGGRTTHGAQVRSRADRDQVAEGLG